MHNLHRLYYMFFQNFWYIQKRKSIIDAPHSSPCGFSAKMKNKTISLTHNNNRKLYFPIVKI